MCECATRGLGRLRRRSLLAMPLLMPAAEAMAQRAAGPRVLSLRNLHTGERFVGPYWASGGVLPEAREALDHLLRDHREDRATAMDPRLFDMLWGILSRLGGRNRSIDILSAYRTPETNRPDVLGTPKVAKNSMHLQGRAIDLRVFGVTLPALANLAFLTRLGGVGIYRADAFVHIDTGPVRRWAA